MKVFINMFTCDLKRAIFSTLFAFSVLGYVGVTLLTLFDEGTDFQTGSTTIVYIYTIIRYLDFHIIYILFAAIPSALLFCFDWEHQFIRSVLIRCPKKFYTISKVLSCFISAASSVLLSNIILLSIFAPHYPLFNNASDMLPDSYRNYGPLIYLLVKILCEAACAGFLSIAALALSTVLTNPFVALASPMALYYIISVASYYFSIPQYLHIAPLSQGLIQVCQNPILSLVYILFVFAVASTIVGYLFVKNCTRRIQNG